MAMHRDNDIVKALGFVALYASYLEESVDLVMERLAPVKPIADRDRRRPSSQKLEWCLEALASRKSSELADLSALLESCKDLFKRRNELIHGRIYAGHDRNDYLKSSRNDTEREVTANELYDLAEAIFAAQASVSHLGYFATIRAINKGSHV